MNFKDRAAADIGKVFLNTSRFGEVVTINENTPYEKNITVVIDEDALKERNLAMLREGKLHTDDILFYCAKNEFDKGLPRVEERMPFNGENYKITSMKDDMGMLTITLQRYGGR